VSFGASSVGGFDSSHRGDASPTGRRGHNCSWPQGARRLAVEDGGSLVEVGTGPMKEHRDN
jgi:hypothetical protein